jgi:hypothetical protein
VKRLLLLLPFAVLAQALAAGQVPIRQGQTQAAPKGTGLILGQVTDVVTGRGIAGAIVMLLPPQTAPAPVGELTESRTVVIPLSAPPGSQRVRAAADGRFVFRDLPKGDFTIMATAPTHVPGAFGQQRVQGPGQTITLTDNQKLGGISIALWRNGSISGVITDDNGEPAPGVPVECLRRVMVGGQKRLVQMSAGLRTDDRGMFTLLNAPPGEYVCGCVPTPRTTPMAASALMSTADGRAGTTPESRRLQNSGGSVSAVGARIGDFTYNPGTPGTSQPLPDASGRMRVYGPVYYSGVASSSDATIITVKAGEQRTGINIHLPLVPAVRVSGTLVAPDGQAGFLGVRLVPASGTEYASEGSAEFSYTTSDPAGRFTFLGVPAGQYVLKVRMYPRPVAGTAGNPAASLDEPSLWASTPLTIGSTDVVDLTVPLRLGIRAHGRVEFVGARAQPTALEIQRIGIRLQNSEGRTSSPIPLDGRVQPDGTFKTAGYMGGRYIANVLPSTVPAGWSVKAIMYNGRDVSVEPIDLLAEDVTGLTVTFTDRTTSLSGAVTNAKGPDPSAEVVVFPADSLAWKAIGVVARRGRVERVNKSGAFSISGLPPGDYFVAAVSGWTPGERLDPLLLANLMKDARRVTLDDGGTVNVQLQVK